MEVDIIIYHMITKERSTIMNQKCYYIVTPLLASGGPELAHQMCHELLLQNQKAQMYYIKEPNKEPIDKLPNERYEKYGTSHVRSLEKVEQKNSVVIVPESSAAWILSLKKCRKVLWWMSVDNYILNTKLTGWDYFDILEPEVSLHLVQSQYAHHYLLERGVSQDKILYVSDYISENYGKFQLPAAFRKDIALYTPKKGGDKAIQPLIEKTSWLKWIPLQNFTEEQMILIMEIAKVYVDFGSHPGKDRIPREAAGCGCCIITNRQGSAGFYEDVPIPDRYKIENPSLEYGKTTGLLQDICTNWEEHNKNFNQYRNFISGERKKFSKDVKRFVNSMEKFS